MQISVVIPTCERKERLLSVLASLDKFTYPLHEVIVVDAGDDRLEPSQFEVFENISVKYVSSERSVCIQRNTGIKLAGSAWILLCDDDMEFPPDYLESIVDHIQTHPGAGAVSGRVLQKDAEVWKDRYPISSARTLIWKYLFLLGTWGEVSPERNNFFTRRIIRHYQKKGNYLSKSGWPVNTQFGDRFTIFPVYGLGASLVKKDWLVQSPYDEVLDRHGIGDNYGVIAGFPNPCVHVVNSTFVYHHMEPANRLKRSLQYYRRVLAMDYLAHTKSALRHISRVHTIWSLAGNLIGFLWAGDSGMVRASTKAMWQIMCNRNPYLLAKKQNRKVTEPLL